MDKLKPCPFCGGAPDGMTSSDGFTSIGCLHCNPVFGVMIQGRSEAEAIAAWNTRAERTCRNLEYDPPWFTCSECSFVSVTEWLASGSDTPNYCPNCGARVVEVSGHAGE